MSAIQRLYQSAATKWGKEWGRRDFTIAPTYCARCSDNEKCGKAIKHEEKKCVKRIPCSKKKGPKKGPCDNDGLTMCPKENPCSFIDNTGRPKRKAPPPQSKKCKEKCKKEAAKKK